MTKIVTVILGAGRSGTSLLMNILNALGMSVSNQMIPARYHNTLGPMEDIDIAKVYDNILLPAYKCNRTLPLCNDSSLIDHNSAKQGANQLREILKERLDSLDESNIFGFKDPYISNSLSIWFPIFNSLEVIPRFILVVRNPASVISSREKNFNNDFDTSQLTWLSSNINALKDTGADCFIVHYEELLLNPTPIVESLAVYIGLDRSKVNAAVDVIDRKLNRREQDGINPRNVQVCKLYLALEECHGTAFDRNRLLDIVHECNNDMLGYMGWLHFAYQYIDNQQKLRNQQLKISQLEERINSQNRDLKDIEKLRVKYHLLENEMLAIGKSLKLLE